MKCNNYLDIIDNDFSLYCNICNNKYKSIKNNWSNEKIIKSQTNVDSIGQDREIAISEEYIFFVPFEIKIGSIYDNIEITNYISVRCPCYKKWVRIRKYYTPNISNEKDK